MKKYILHFLFFLTLTVSFNLKAQVTGLWINPVNDVPFIVESTDTTFSTDSLITIFNGELTFSIDSFGVKTWNPVSDTTYRALVGYSAPPIAANQAFNTYQDLFINGINPSDTNFWEDTDWDSLIVNEPWILTDRTLKLSSADMGAIVAWGWYDLEIGTAKIILDPTIPVIEGEEMDYSDNAFQDVNMVFDIEDFKTNTEEIQGAIDGIYTFNKPDFKDTYNDFVVWMKTTKPFLPNSFDYNTYHEWLYEYFYPLASEKIIQIISIDELSNQFQLIQPSTNTYQLIGNITTDSPYSIYDLQGKLVLSGHLNSSENTINIESLPKGMYVIDILIDTKHAVYKLMK